MGGAGPARHTSAIRRRSPIRSRCCQPGGMAVSATGRLTAYWSICLPMRPRPAGTRVSAPAAATTTVNTAAKPSWPMKVIPEAYRPSRAIDTVAAAISTDWPLVATVRPAAATGVTPSMIC